MNPSGAPAHLQFQQRQGPVQHQMPPHMMGQPMGHMMAQPMMPPPHMMPPQQRMMGGFPAQGFVPPAAHQGMMPPRRPVVAPAGTMPMPQMVAKPVQQPIQMPNQHVYPSHSVNPVAQQRDGPAFQFVETAVHAPPHLVQQPQMRSMAGQPANSSQARSSKRGSFAIAIVDPTTKENVISQVSDESGPSTPLSPSVSGNLLSQPFEQPPQSFENQPVPVGPATNDQLPSVTVSNDQLPSVTVSLSPAGADRVPILFGNMPSELTKAGSPVRQQSRMKFATKEPPIMSLDGLAAASSVMAEAQVDIVHDVLAEMEDSVESMKALDDDVQLIGIGPPPPVPSSSSQLKLASDPATEIAPPIVTNEAHQAVEEVPASVQDDSAVEASSSQSANEPSAECVAEVKQVTPGKVNRFVPPASKGANRFAPAPAAKPVEVPKPAAARPKERKKYTMAKEEHGTFGQAGLMDAFTLKAPEESKPAAEDANATFSTPLSQASTAPAEEEAKKEDDEEWDKREEPSTTAEAASKDGDEDDDWEQKDPDDFCFRPSSSLGAGCSWGSGMTRSAAKKEETRYVYSLALMKKYQKSYTTPHPELSTLDEELKEEVVELFREQAQTQTQTQTDRGKPGSWRQGMMPPSAVAAASAATVSPPLSWRNQEQRVPEGSPNWESRSQPNNAPRMDPFAQLARSETRWAPKKNTTDDEVVLKKVVGLLNKLTMEKFERLTEDLLTVGITSLVVLKGVICLIFEKALAEQKFAAMYSELCVRLASGCPEFSDEDNGKIIKITFKKILLNKCQEEFENAGKVVEPENLENEEEKELFHIKRRMRLIGLIKFICELFKKRMVAEKIVHACILHLLKKPEDEEMECLCRLFEGAGQMLDREEARRHMDSYFDRMGKFPRSQFSSRVRFMMQDVIALRRCQWEPRNALAGPKTLAEIRRDGLSR